MKLRNVLAIIKLRGKTGSPSLRRIMTDKNGIPEYPTLISTNNNYDTAYNLSSK